MRLSRPLKFLIGALTLCPVVYLVFFFVIMIAGVFRARPRGPESMPIDFELLFALHLATMLLVFALIAFYITFLFKTQVVSQDKKALWAVILFLGNMIAMPIFWWLYVWPELPSAQSGST